MKSNHLLRNFALTVFAIFASISSVTRAATLTWDPSGGGASDGAGAWLTVGDWWDGVSNVNWTSGDDAIFGNGGAGGAVTLASPTTVNSLTFNSFTGTYTLGTAGQTITLNNGITMNSGAGAATIISPITLGAAQSWINNDDSLLTITGAVTNGGFLLTIGGTGNTTVSSAIGGAGGLTKSGAGTLTLSGGSGYTGGTNIGAGTISFTSTGLGSASTANKITFTGNSTLQWGASTTTDLSARLIIDTGVTATLDTGANNVTFASVFGLENNSKGTLNKTGSGTLTLSNAANQFAGNTVITNGKVALGNQYGMWQSAYDTTGSTGAIGLNVTGFTTPWLGGLAGSVDLATAITGYSAITSLTLNPQSGSSVSYGGVIANGAAAMTLNKTGLGTQTLTGANSYSGATTVWAGTLALSGASGTALNSAFTVRGGTLELDNSTNLVASRLADGTAISLGSLTLKGFNTGGVQGETVGATTFAVGGKVTVINGSTALDRTDLTMGAVTRSTGAAIDFVGGGLGTLGGGANSPNVTSSGAFPNIQNNILPWATVGGTQWATTGANGIVAFTPSFTTLAAATSTTQAQQTGAATLVGALNTNSLNVISDASSNLLALGGNTISFGSTNAASTLGAILKSGTNAYTISGGTIQVGTGGAGTELIAHVDGGALAISANLNATINSIAKGGTGDLILSGTRKADFNGNISIAGGQLEFQGASTTLSGVITGAGGLTVNLNAGQTLTMGNNANSYAGPTIVKGGYLASPAFGSQGLPGGINQTPSTNTSQIGSNLILNGGVFYASYTFNKDLGAGPGQVQILAGTSGFVNTAGSGGASGFVLNGSRELVWGSTYFNPTVFVHSTVGDLTLNLANGFDLNGSTRTILVGDATYNANAGGGRSQLGGVIRTSSGTAGITKTGIGTLLLTGANTFNGVVTVSQGTLDFNGNANVAVANPLGQSSAAAANLLLANGTTLRYSGAAASTDRSFTINGTAAGDSASLDASGSAAVNFSSTASPAYGTAGQTRTLILTGTSTFNNTLAANIADNGAAVSVTKTGAGLWVLSGTTSSYTGPTTINAGTLSVSASNNLGGATSNLVFNGGTLQVTNTTNLPNLSTIGHTVVFNSGVTVGLDISSGTFTADLPLTQGTGGLTKLGAGTLALNQTNTYTGQTTISAGTLRLDDGGVIASPEIRNNATFTVNRTGTVTQGTQFSSLISGTGALVNSGSGNLILNAANTFTGTTTVSAGTISMTNALALQYSAYNTTGSNGTIGLNVTSGLNSGSLTLGGLAGGVDLASAFAAGFTGSVSNLILNPQGAQSNTYTGIIANTTMALTKTGTGTQVLQGVNSYSGVTSLNAGVLELSGSGSILNSALTFNGGGLTLTNIAAETGSGRVADATTITSNGGTLTYNNTSGTILYAETIGPVALTNGQFNIVQAVNQAGAGSQTLTIGNSGSGNLTQAGSSAVTFSSAGTRTTKNMIVVTGATATAANEIIAPWATIGTTAALQTDYAIYNGSAQAVDRNIAASAQSTWSTTATAASNYTANAGFGAGGSITLNATRNLNSLRSISASNSFLIDDFGNKFTLASNTFVDGDAVVFNGTIAGGLTAGTVYYVVNSVAGSSFQVSATQGGSFINLSSGSGNNTDVTGALLVSSGNNLGTLGILNGVSSTQYIAATGTGVVTLPSTTSDNLHVTTGSGPIIISAPIVDNGAGVLTLVKNGTGGTLTLSQPAGYTGGTVINAGTLTMAAGTTGTTVFTGPITLATGATLHYAPTGGFTLTGDAGVITSGNITLTGGVGSTATITLSGSDKKFTINGTVTGQSGVNQTLAILQGGTIVSQGERQDLLFANTIADGGSGGKLSLLVNFTRASTAGQNAFVNLTGQNTFTGDLTVNNSAQLNGFGSSGNAAFPGAWVTIGSDRNKLSNTWTAGTGFLGAGADYSGNITLNTGNGTSGTGLTTLAFNTTANQFLRGVISGGGSIYTDGSGTLTLTAANTYTGTTTAAAGTLSLTGSLTGSNIVTSATGVFNQSTTGLIAGSGVTFTQGSSGTSILSGANTYTGATTINAGILQSAKASALSTTSSVTVTNAGSTLAVNFGGAADYSAAEIVTLLGKTTFSTITTNLGFDTTNGSATYGNVLGMAAGLTKLGVNTLTLDQNNTYTGATRVNLGVLKLANADALGSTTGVTVSTGGALDLNGQTTARPFSAITGAGQNGGGALINSSGTTGTLTGTVALTAASVIGGVNNITISNTTGLTGSFLLQKIGNGTLTVIDTTTTSARTGLNQIDAGILQIQSATNLASVGTGAFVLNGGNLVIGNDAGYNQANALTVLSSGTITTDKYLTAAGAVTNTLSGALTMGGNSTLTVKSGSVASAATMGLTLGALTSGGAATAPGNPTFDVQSTATTATTLTLGALGDQGIAPRTWTFQNGSAFGSTVTLATAAGSLIDGSTVNVSATSGAVNLNLTNATSLGSLAQVAVGSGNTLTIGVSTQTIGSLAGAGSVALGTNTLTIGNTANSSAYNTNFSGVLGTAAAGIVTKNSTSTLTFSGNSANLYTGLTTVNNGTLILAKTGGVNALAGSLTVGSATGLAKVQLSGAGEQILNTATVIIGNSGTLDLNGFNETVGTVSTMTGGNIIGSGSTLILAGAGATTTATLANTISTNLQLTANAGTATTRTLALTSVTDSLAISGNITEGTGPTVGTITKTGNGILTLSGNNSYTGLTTISAGILNIQNSANSTQLGTTALGTTVTSGATLQIQGGVTTAAEGLTLNGAGFVGSNGINIQTGALVNVSGTNNYAGLLNLATASTISSDSGTLNLTNVGTITGTTTPSLTLAGAGNGSIASIIGTGANTLTKNGTGTWALTGANTFTGAVTVSAGTLQLGNGTAGSFTTPNALTFSAGSGTFEFVGNSATGSTQGMGALTATSGAGTVKIVAPATSGTNQLTFASLAATAAGASLNFVSPANTKVVFTAAPTVTKGVIGAGTLFFNGADFATYSSGVVAATYSDQAANLVAGLNAPTRITGSFTNGSSLTVDSGIKFDTAQTLTIGNGFLVTINNAAGSAGGILATGGIAASILDQGTATGLTTGGAGTLVIRTDTSSDSLTIGAKITSTTTGGIAKTGLGTLTLNATNAYTGTTFVDAGTLQLGAAAAMAATAATVHNGATLDLGSQTITNAVTLNGTGISAGGSLISSTGAATVGAITIGAGLGTGSIGASIGGSNNITSTGALVGNVILVKSGTGTLTFGNSAVNAAVASTRTGATRIDQGTLRISNSTTAIGAATAPIILNGGTLSLGSTASVAAYPTTVNTSSGIVSDVFTSGAGLTHTLGALAIGTQTLTITAGSNVTTASTNAGVTFGASTLTGNSTFDVQSPTTATSGTTTLTLGALSDNGVARALTFQNTGTATTASRVTLGAAAASLIDGTTVAVNAGTNGGITLNANIASALGSLAQVTLTNSGANVATLSLGAAQTIASLSGNGNVIGAQTLTVGNANSTATGNTTYSGVLGFGTVATALTKAGNGTLTLSGINLYTGATTISGGILKIGNTSALGGTGTGTTINTTGVLDLAGFSIAEPLTISGAGMNGGGALIDSVGGGSLTGAVALGAASTVNVSTGALTINNTTGLTGNFLLNKIGNGTLTIADSTTTSGRTGVNQIDAGTLRIESSSVSSITPIGTGAFTMDGSTLSLGFNVSNNSNTGAVNVVTSSTIVADRQASGAGGITHTLGALTIGGNTLTVQAGSNFNGSTPTVGLTLGAVTIGGAATAPGNPTFDVQSTANAAMTLTLGALSDQGIVPRTWTFQNGSAFASTVTLGSASAVGSLQDGTIVNVANTTGAVNLNLNAAGALGTLSQVTVGSGNTIRLGASQTFGSLAGSGTVSATGSPFTLTIGNAASSSAYNTNFSGSLNNSTGTLSLVKAGTGTQTLTGTNTYTGATTINQGILSVGTIATPTGSINSSAVTINGGNFRYNSATNYTNTLTFTSGTISGTNWNGSLDNLTIGTNQTISPGNSPGTTNTGSQTWATGGTYEWEVNNVTATAGGDPGWDLLNGSGTLNITAVDTAEFTIDVMSLTLANAAGAATNFNDSTSYNWMIANFNAITGFSADAFTIDTIAFAAHNTFTGAFAVALGNSPGIGGDNTQIWLTYTAIPEPKAALLGCLGLLLILRRRR